MTKDDASSKGSPSPVDETRAYRIEGFAKAHKISRSQVFVEIKEKRLQPMKVGRRTIISIEAAADWRHLMEDLTAHPS